MDYFFYFSEVDETLRPLLPEFFDNLDDDMKELGEHIKARESEAARKIAHGIKGAAGSFGLIVFHVTAAELEDSLRSTEIAWRDVESLFEELRGKADTARKIL